MRTIICLALGLYSFILFIRAILSWVSIAGWSPPSSLAPLIRGVYDLTEPPLSFLRRYIPSMGSGGVGIDLSFLVLFLIIIVIRGAIC